MAYDAFISYSHSADGKLAPALQRALRTLAKPWYRLRSLNVFLDKTNLSAASDLTSAIRSALSSSRYFVYLASPDAAGSRWVGEEIKAWEKRNLPENLLIAVTEGEIEWDTDHGSFDWEKSNALHQNLKGIFSREPLWVDLRWAKEERNLSPRDPRFQRATAMLAAPMHGKTLEELVGEDVRQHRRTKILTGVIVGALTLLLALSILATRIATKTNQSLQSKLTLIEIVLPFFNLGEADLGDEPGNYSLFKRLWSGITSSLLGPNEMEKWIEWGPERLAVADDCFDRRNEDVGGGFECPRLKSAYDEDGLRTDIEGLSTMVSTFVSSLNNGRVKELLRNSAIQEIIRKEQVSETTGEDNEDDDKPILDRAKVLLPERIWKKVAKDIEKNKRDWEFFSRHYFQIWRKPLDGAGGGAELIFIRLVDAAYCGSRGCNSPTLGFLRVGKKYELIFANDESGRIAVYDTGRGNMPQIFTITATQAGAYDQYREMLRYSFDGDECLCYRPYLAGAVRSSQGPDKEQRVPQQLVDLPKQPVNRGTKGSDPVTTAKPEPMTAVSSPENTMKSYYSAVERRQVDDALRMYASKKQPNINRRTIEAVAQDTEYYQIERMTTTYNDHANRATVSVTMHHKKYGKSKETWKITAELVRENGEWKILSTQGRK